MGAFENYRKAVIERFGNATENEMVQTDEVPTDDEWTWVTGYKGTDKNMKCRGFQYEMKKPFTIPDDQDVAVCSNGFHLCKKLKDVFDYYDVGKGNRFFEVSALVRKKDLDEYVHIYHSRKLVARCIMFVRELDVDEILKDYIKNERDYWRYPDDEFALENWSDETKQVAINDGVQNAIFHVANNALVTLGYSIPFADYINRRGAYQVAKMVGAQTDLSMDLKAMYIFNEIQRIADKPSAMSYAPRRRR